MQISTIRLYKGFIILTKATQCMQFMKMVGAGGKYYHGAGAEWWKGGCCNHNGVQAHVSGDNYYT